MQVKKHYYWLDPLRALCAFLVLFVHARSTMFALYVDLTPSSQNIFTQVFYAICSLGGFAVAVFFILSGFLIGGRSIEKAAKGQLTIRRFVLDRVFRIGVPLTGALLLICCVNYIIGGADNIEWGQLLGQYTGLQGVVFKDYGGVFWTLAYEIWFYIILLAAIIVFSLKYRMLSGLTLLVASSMVCANLETSWLFIIILGIVCYRLKDYNMPRRVLTSLQFLLPILFIVWFICSGNLLSTLAGRYVDIRYLVRMKTASQVLLFSSISIVLSQYVTMSPKCLCSRAIHKLGGVFSSFSYSLYLTHAQVLKLWKAYMPVQKEVDVFTMGYFLALCTCCIAVAWVFYQLFEKNTVKIQRFVEKRLNI